LEAAQVTQPPASTITQAPAIAPAVEPSTTFMSIPFQADEVSFFDPGLDESYEGDMLTIGKDLWFRDVFLFSDRLNDIAIAKADAVRSNWTSCLRGAAITWYQSEWDGYDTWLHTKSLEVIIDDLITRFRDSPDKALHKLNKLRFTIASLQEGKKPLTFTQSYELLGMLASILINFPLHDRLQVELRTQIDRSATSTSDAQFIQQLNDKYTNWQELHCTPRSTADSIRIQRQLPRPIL
jgi:hypothetical protein